MGNNKQKNPAWIAINRALDEKGIKKEAFSTQVEKETGLSRRMFYWYQKMGWFPQEQAVYIGKALGFAPSLLMKDGDNPTPGLDYDIVEQSYALFVSTVNELGLDWPVEKQANAYSAFLKQSLESGRVDPSILEAWLKLALS